MSTRTTKRSSRGRTKDALTIIDRITGDDAKVQRMIAKARINAEAAQMIYDARKGAGLSQKQLAELVGTTQSVIARLKDADYQGHSLSMLQRIAEALNRSLEIQLKA